MNLVVNARDAMHEGGKIVLSTGALTLDAPRSVGVDTIPSGSYVSISVSDDGVGMDETTRNKIFEPFFTTKDLGKGTGLGLATVYGTVAQSEGYVEVTSEPGRGATFTLYFPAVVETAPVPLERPRSNGVRGGSESVLLVEDEGAVRSLARRVLESAGYGVVEARYGDEALLVSERHDGCIDMLLTDLVMPGMSGSELAERLAADRPELKVLFMSGYADEMEPFRETGAFLPKPFLPEDMLRAVRNVLDT
jgi:CheY-like chemotaxis protein